MLPGRTHNHQRLDCIERTEAVVPRRKLYAPRLVANQRGRKYVRRERQCDGCGPEGISVVH
ncbi:hypothetical protein, partial [Salmonella sp. SAL4433]|uniref:hypothetical protein n=1 Tax=Salmonella sp. SAL4433 TaxID=3159888 RepID=UPI00397E5A3F